MDAFEVKCFAIVVVLEQPETVGVAAEDFHATVLGVNQDVFFQTIEGLVVVEFVASIEGFGGFGEDFDDEFGEAFVGVDFPVAGVASDEDIGVKEVVTRVDASFHIRDENPAAGTPQMRSQLGKEVAGNRDMGIGCPCHGEDIAVEVFVFAEAVGFELQVLFGGEVGRSSEHDVAG